MSSGNTLMIFSQHYNENPFLMPNVFFSLLMFCQSVSINHYQSITHQIEVNFYQIEDSCSRLLMTLMAKWSDYFHIIRDYERVSNFRKFLIENQKYISFLFFTRKFGQIYFCILLLLLFLLQALCVQDWLFMVFWKPVVRPKCTYFP